MDYRERLTPPIPWLTLAGLLGASFGLIAYPINARAALVTMALLGAACVALLIISSPRIAVHNGWLDAGSAHIDTSYLVDITIVTGTQLRAALNDPRAYAVYRPYCAHAVRATLHDPRDPTPYWLISTARPDQLAAALSSRTPRRLVDHSGQDMPAGSDDAPGSTAST